MRGLAKSKPSTAVVKVSSRYARKHYGEEIRVKFDERIHDKSKRLLTSVKNAGRDDY